MNQKTDINVAILSLLRCGLLGLALTACNSKDADFSVGSSNGSSAPVIPLAIDPGAQPPAEADQNAESERVEVPSAIVGANLVCSLRKEASETDLASDYGCRLNEAGSETKLDITAQENSIIWSSDRTEGIAIDPRSKVSAWHAIYTVTGGSIESIREAADKIRIIVQWTEAGKPSASFQDKPLNTVLRPIATSGDIYAPILQGIDPSDPGEALPF